jgi:hypothetical protein
VNWSMTPWPADRAAGQIGVRGCCRHCGTPAGGQPGRWVEVCMMPPKKVRGPYEG